jgi:hypothetical protein
MAKRLGIQTKLRLSEPGDAYEQQADRLADAVISVPEPLIARSEHESLEPSIASYGGHSPLLMRKLENAQPPLEREDEEERQPLQRKRVDRGLPRGERDEDAFAAAGQDFGNLLNAEERYGAALEPGVRAFMESRFGVDFGRVRVHTSPRAAMLAQAARAEAFTVGQHMYFGANYYDPRSTRGRRLLAHELAHTLQQSAVSVLGVRPAGRVGGGQTAVTRSSLTRADSGNVLVQRAMADTFVPPELPSGELVHAELLETIGQTGGNEDLFSEVKIPGATARNTAETAGRADFYRVDGRNKTTIGVIMVGGEPRYLESHYQSLGALYKSVASMTTKAGSRYKHKELSAPRGSAPTETGCDGGPFTICRLDKAPEKILLGDLKPPPSLERFNEGKIQIANYQTGISNTTRDLNKYVKGHPVLVSPNKTTWHPDTGAITSIAIPDKLTLAGAKKLPALRLYDKRKRDNAIKGLSGPLVVYKGTEPGVWHYEWIPKDVPPEVRAAAKAPRLIAALARIDDLVEQLKTPPPKIDGGKKSLPHSGQPRANTPYPSPGLDLVQRTAKPFDPKTWPEDFKMWQQHEATDLLGSREVGLVGVSKSPVPESPEAKTVEVAQGMLGIAERVPAKELTTDYRALPRDVGNAVKGFRRIKLWAHFGGLFGQARILFGRLFTKISEFYDKAKEKFDEARKKHAATAGDSDAIIDALVKTALQVGVLFIKAMVTRVAADLKRSLVGAAKVLVADFFGEDNLARITELKEGLTEFVKDIEEKIEAIAQPVDEYLKPLATVFKIVNDVRGWMRDLTRFVDAIKWGLRIVQCLTPPGFGCLKLLLQKLTEYLIAKWVGVVVKTCWFRVKFIKPIFNTFKTLRSIPDTISNFVLGLVKKLVGALPLGFSGATLDKAFPKIDHSTDMSERELECDDQHLTPAQIEMNKLVDKYGEDEIRRMIKLLEDAGITDDTEMTEVDVKILDALIDKIHMGNLTEDQLMDAARRFKRGQRKDLKDMNRILDELEPEPVPGSEAAAAAAAARGKVTVVSAEKARFTGQSANCGRACDRLGVSLEGSSEADKPDKDAVVTLVLSLDGKPIVQVPDAKATVVDARTLIEEGHKYKYFRYRLKHAIRFPHAIKGIPVPIVGTDQIFNGDMQFPIEEPTKEPAKAAP